MWRLLLHLQAADPAMPPWQWNFEVIVRHVQNLLVGTCTANVYVGSACAGHAFASRHQDDKQGQFCISQNTRY